MFCLLRIGKNTYRAGTDGEVLSTSAATKSRENGTRKALESGYAEGGGKPANWIGHESSLRRTEENL